MRRQKERLQSQPWVRCNPQFKNDMVVGLYGWCGGAKQQKRGRQARTSVGTHQALHLHREKVIDNVARKHLAAYKVQDPAWQDV